MKAKFVLRVCTASAAVGLVGAGLTGTASAGVGWPWGGGGPGGSGGTAVNNCLNIGFPIASGVGFFGSGYAAAATCSASANG